MSDKLADRRLTAGELLSKCLEKNWVIKDDQVGIKWFAPNGAV
jgi:hypothetical protein